MFMAIGLGFGLALIWINVLLHQPKFYNKTLGKISYNYTNKEHRPFDIVQEKKGFETFEDDKLIHWDAVSYYCMKERLYDTSTGCDNKVRPAYFPLFPLIWKASHLSSAGISAFNYCCLILSLIILLEVLIVDSRNKWAVFLLFLCMPQDIFFIIPYTEAVFLLMFSCTVYALILGDKKLYFIAAFLAGMCRPASLIYVIALLIYYAIIFYQANNKRALILGLLFQLVPFLLAYAAVVLMQFYYTHDWIAISHAHDHWDPVIYSWPKEIRDWSVESFGTSAFSICFIFIPGIIYLLYLIFTSRKNSLTEPGMFKEHVVFKKHFLLQVCLIYFTIIGVLIIGRNGGDIHSLSRLSLATPFFYILTILGFEKVQNFSLQKRFILFGGSVILLTVFLSVVKYGDHKFQFCFLGMFELIAAAVIIYLVPPQRKILYYVMLMCLGFCNLFWLAYLFNDFLTPGWIFT